MHTTNMCIDCSYRASSKDIPELFTQGAPKSHLTASRFALIVDYKFIINGQFIASHSLVIVEGVVGN